MSTRFDYTMLGDGAGAANRLEKAASAPIEPVLYNLVKLRASIVNGCAFCVDMHSTHLLGQGVDVRRVYAVATWHESPFFDEAERAVFALTDAVTRLPEGGVPDAVWDRVAHHVGVETAAQLVLAIATINVWNRLAIASGKQPPALQAA